MWRIDKPLNGVCCHEKEDCIGIVRRWSARIGAYRGHWDLGKPRIWNHFDCRLLNGSTHRWHVCCWETARSERLGVGTWPQKSAFFGWFFIEFDSFGQGRQGDGGLERDCARCQYWGSPHSLYGRCNRLEQWKGGRFRPWKPLWCHPCQHLNTAVSQSR